MGCHVTQEEKHRLMCELRYWISKGYRGPIKLEELKKTIQKHRGLKSAELLVKRIEWYIRNN